MQSKLEGATVRPRRAAPAGQKRPEDAKFQFRRWRRPATTARRAGLTPTPTLQITNLPRPLGHGQAEAQNRSAAQEASPDHRRVGHVADDQKSFLQARDPAVA